MQMIGTKNFSQLLICNMQNFNLSKEDIILIKTAGYLKCLNFFFLESLLQLLIIIVIIIVLANLFVI